MNQSFQPKAQVTYLSTLTCVLVSFSFFLNACRQEQQIRVIEKQAGEMSGGESQAGESQAGESQAGESQAGESQAGESLAELSCDNGLVAGPMLTDAPSTISFADLVTSATNDSNTESEQNPDQQARIRLDQDNAQFGRQHIYGHYRPFSSLNTLSKSEVERLATKLVEHDRQWGFHEVLAVIHGNQDLPSVQRLSPLGRGFWLASIKHTPSTTKQGLTLLSWQDKISFGFRKVLKTQDLSALMTARITLWANSKDELRTLLKDPLFTVFKEDSASDLDPLIAERDWQVGFAHHLSHNVNGQIVQKRIPSLRFTTKARQLSLVQWKLLAQHPRVIMVSEPETLPKLLNEPSRDLMHMDQMTRPQFIPGYQVPQYEGWAGREVRVAIMDSGVAIHPDFYMYDEQGEVLFDRVRGELPPSDQDGHGTTVAGILAGNGYASTAHTSPLGLPNAPFQWRGQAPLVREIYSHLMFGTGNASDAPPWTQMFEARSAHLANHSHTFGNGFYTNEPQGYDGFISGVTISEEQLENGGLEEATAFNTAPRPVFLSAGNNGLYPQDNIFMRLHGYYGLLVNLKNGILVGSVESNDAQPSDFSSMGPTLDGRLKPDFMAPGSKDERPLSGFKIELGEIRIHAKPNSGKADIAWQWGRDHHSMNSWQGEGAFAPEYVTFNEGILIGETFGSWATRVFWERAEEAPVISAEDYESISFEYRSELPDSSMYDPLPSLGRPDLKTNHSAPQVWMFRWGDDIGRGYDETRFLRHTEESKSGEWTRVSYRFDEGWSGEVSRLRIIPAIYWGGVYTTSMWGGYDYVSGTSMASPAAAGVGAAALEQLSVQHGYDLEENPAQPALIRALMIQSARDLSRPVAPPRAADCPDTGFPPIYGEGPDFSSGYGLLDADFMTKMIDQATVDQRWHEATINPNEVHQFTIRVSNQGPLTVTLAWDDPPGSIITPSWEGKLVHDLDLALVSPIGQAHGPWVLAPPPLKLDGYEAGIDDLALSDIPPARRCVVDSIQSLWSEEDASIEPSELSEELEYAPRGNERCLDNLNTNEQVLIKTPQSGEYTIYVRGPRTGGASQKYVLTWSQTCPLDSPMSNE